jgi:hypothetical protein
MYRPDEKAMFMAGGERWPFEGDLCGSEIQIAKSNRIRET